MLSLHMLYSKHLLSDSVPTFGGLRFIVTFTNFLRIFRNGTGVSVQKVSMHICFGVPIDADF